MAVFIICWDELQSAMLLQASFAALVVMGGGGHCLSGLSQAFNISLTGIPRTKKTYGITESTNAHDDGLKSEFKPTGLK